MDNKKYTVEKNKLDAIELSMEDTDAEFAKIITLAARDFVNKRANDLVKQNQTKILVGFEASIKQQQLEIKHLEDSMKVIRANYGIYNIETQSQIITDLTSIAHAKLARYSAQVKALEKEPNASQDTIIMMRSLVKGLENELNVLNRSNTSSFNNGMGAIEVLAQMHEQKGRQLSYDAVRIAQLRAAQQSDVPAIYVVEEPQVAMIKSRPKRSLLVLAAMFVTFAFTTLGIILLENYRIVHFCIVKNA